MYDVIISLGYNCEISQRLKCFYNKLDSYPFSWIYIYGDYIATYKKILDLSVFDEEYEIRGTMLFFKKTKASFHTKFKKEDLILQDGSINADNVQQALSELKLRFMHLVEKFNILSQSDKKVLFIIKLKNSDIQQNIKQLRELVAYIKDLSYKKFFILSVVEEKNWSEELNQFVSEHNDLLAIDTVKFFAKDPDTLYGGDIYGWYDLLNFYNSDAVHKNRFSRITNASFLTDKWKKIDALLEKYKTARVDIKNFGSNSNDMHIASSDSDYCKIVKPKWFSNNKGIGYVIFDKTGHIKLNIEIINDGILTINLRGVDYKDLNFFENQNKRIPIYIKYYTAPH